MGRRIIASSYLFRRAPRHRRVRSKIHLFFKKKAPFIVCQKNNLGTKHTRPTCKKRIDIFFYLGEMSGLLLISNWKCLRIMNVINGFHKIWWTRWIPVEIVRNKRITLTSIQQRLWCNVIKKNIYTMNVDVVISMCGLSGLMCHGMAHDFASFARRNSGGTGGAEPSMAAWTCPPRRSVARRRSLLGRRPTLSGRRRRFMMRWWRWFRGKRTHPHKHRKWVQRRRERERMRERDGGYVMHSSTSSTSSPTTHTHTHTRIERWWWQQREQHLRGRTPNLCPVLCVSQCVCVCVCVCVWWLSHFHSQQNNLFVRFHDVGLGSDLVWNKEPSRPLTAPPSSSFLKKNENKKTKWIIIRYRSKKKEAARLSGARVLLNANRREIGRPSGFLSLSLSLSCLCWP